MQSEIADLEFATGDVEQSLRSLDHPAAVIRGDFTIVAANQSYAKLFRREGRPIVGRHCYEVTHGYSKPCEEIGERCPLDRARSERHWAEAVHSHYTAAGKELENVVVRPVGRVDGHESFLEVVTPVSAETDVCCMVGSGRAFRRMMELVERVAKSEIPVLLLGETGTGKELVASEIHRRSRRGHRNFVPVDCSGLAATLFESELFGHERGAFTGATQPKKGLVEAATGGTLFLDEIGDVPLPQQVKLLRLLETGLYRHVGSTDLRRSDFRLVCATHRDLRSMVQAGEFRRDLYHRINAFPIELPPLRHRPEDLAAIANQLLRRIEQRKPRTLSAEAIRALEQYAFPGNVRELLNVLERACLLADGDEILPEHLPDEVRGIELPASVLPGAEFPFDEQILPLDQVEHHYLRWVMSQHDGDRRELARRLGISERSLYRKLSASGS